MHFFSWLHNKSKIYIPHISTLAAMVFFLVTYILIKSADILINSKLIFGLIYFEIILVLIICYHLFNGIKKIFRFSKPKKNNRFRKQITLLFSFVTILPAVCVFIFSILFFNVGIENLFKTPIKNVIDNAEQVASIYINDMKINMERFVTGVGLQVARHINGLAINQSKINSILAEETTELKVDVMVFQLLDKSTINVLSSTPFTMSLHLQEIPQQIFNMESGVISWESDDSILSASVINYDLGIYLLASTTIDGMIMDHKHKIKTAVTEYANLASQRSWIKLTFMTFFSVITLLLLLVSIVLGGMFANWILRPVNKLIIATKNVTSGDYNTQIKTKEFKNEWDVLIATFNDMMSKLEQQKQQLTISNKQNAWRDIARKIAHEIKNPLTPIQLSAERLRNKYKSEITTSPEVFNSCIDTIIRQVRCIGKLVKEFSDFARMPAPKIEKIDIVKLLNDIVLIQSNAHKNIKFHQYYDESVSYGEIDQEQINQVMMNILQNSINAICENHKGNGDKADIIGNISLSFKTDKSGFMNIVVEDDGPGFSGAAMEKALDPYYTTRENGTGLGLSIVHKIITDHFGEINLGISQKLGGARISMKIPTKYQNTNEEKHGI